MKCVIVAGLIIAGATLAFQNDTQVVTVNHVVKPGETMWMICNNTYMDNNAESFGEFVYNNVELNGSTIHTGQVVTIKNVVKR